MLVVDLCSFERVFYFSFSFSHSFSFSLSQVRFRFPDLKCRNRLQVKKKILRICCSSIQIKKKERVKGSLLSLAC